jgi:hypothetical protein
MKERAMTANRSLLARLRGILGTYHSASAASAAMESGHAPAARDLRRLGIDTAAFAAINNH